MRKIIYILFAVVVKRPTSRRSDYRQRDTQNSLRENLASLAQREASRKKGIDQIVTS